MDLQPLDRLRSRAALALATVALLVGAAAPVAAAGSGAIVVRGIQHEYGSCEDAGDAGYLMTGDLEGCWVVVTFDVKSQFDGKAHFMATGVERFVAPLRESRARSRRATSTPRRPLATGPTSSRSTVGATTRSRMAAAGSRGSAGR